MSHKPDLQAIKSANGERKRRETAIHRVIDAYVRGKSPDYCMREICQIIGRIPRVSILNGKEG